MLPNLLESPCHHLEWECFMKPTLGNSEPDHLLRSSLVLKLKDENSAHIFLPALKCKLSIWSFVDNWQNGFMAIKFFATVSESWKFFVVPRKSGVLLWRGSFQVTFMSFFSLTKLLPQLNYQLETKKYFQKWWETFNHEAVAC